jgi:hypothetical protein
MKFIIGGLLLTSAICALTAKKENTGESNFRISERKSCNPATYYHDTIPGRDTMRKPRRDTQPPPKSHFDFPLSLKH